MSKTFATSVYMAQRLYALSKFGPLPGAGPIVPRVNRAVVAELGQYWEAEVRRLTGLDEVSQLERTSGTPGPFLHDDAIEPTFDPPRAGRLPTEMFYDGPLNYGSAKGLVGGWKTFIDGYTRDVAGTPVDGAGFLSEAATRAWWEWLAILAGTTGIFIATGEFRIMSTWESFLDGAADLPADLGKAAADALNAVTKAGARGLGAFLGTLLTSPGGLLLVGVGVAAFLFREQLTRTVVRWGM